MSKQRSTILQIVPRLPGKLDGLGDYALALAKALSNGYGLDTIFAVADKTPMESKDGFEVVPGLASALQLGLDGQRFEHVILHYVNYGYQPRGVPFQLRDIARRLRAHLRGRWITTFHELYASGPPWKSAFWLRPFQVRIARNLIDISDSCFVSNKPIRNVIARYDPTKPITLQPVFSNFGEPALVKGGAVPDRSAERV